MRTIPKRYVLLVLWLTGIIAPMAFLGRYSKLYDRLFTWLFAPTWMHILTHALLFAILAFLLAVIIDKSAQARSGYRLSLTVLGMVLIIAILQESVQLWFKARPLSPDEAFDIVVDLCGTCLGLLAYGWVHYRRHSSV